MTEQAGREDEVFGCPSGALTSHYKPSARKYSKKELNDRLRYAEAKEWSTVHKRHISPLPLPDATERRIRQWFELVDDDGSGRLNKTELEFALKASGIPADASAILEIINLFDFDRDGEIAWREFHDFLSHEVAADKDPLGAEYVLPSGTALPLGSMIGAIRRRKIISDVEKGGSSRGFWVAEGPEFLRYLLESEHYSLDQHNTSRIREVLLRILAYKPPASKEVDPDALEAHKRRIERLKQMLMRTASYSNNGGAASSENGAVAPGGGGGGSSARPSPRGVASVDRLGIPSIMSPRGSRAVSGAALRLSARGSADGAGLGGGLDGAGLLGGRRSGRPSPRFATSQGIFGTEAGAVAASASAVGTVAGSILEALGRQGEGGSADGAELTSPRREAAGPGCGSGCDGGNGNAGGVDPLVAEDSQAIESAVACAEQMRRLEEVLEQHRQRTGSAKPSARSTASGGSIALSSSGSRVLTNHRSPVVVPIQVAAASAFASPGGAGSAVGLTPRRRITGDSGGGGLEGADAGSSGSAGSVGIIRPQEVGPSSSAGSVASGGVGSWVASAAKRPTPPPPRTVTAAGGAVTAGAGQGTSAGEAVWVAMSTVCGVGRRPVPPPPRGVATVTGGGGVGGGEGAEEAALGSSSLVASAAGQQSALRTSLDCQRTPPSAEGVQLAHGAGEGAIRTAAAGNEESGGRGGSGDDAGTVEAMARTTLDAAAGRQAAQRSSGPCVAIPAGSDTASSTGIVNDGSDAASSPNPQTGLLSSPQPAVPRLNTQLAQRSLSTGRGPYTATLVRSARANGRTRGPVSPRHTSTGEPSASGGAPSALDAERSSANRRAGPGFCASPMRRSLNGPATSWDSGAGGSTASAAWVASANCACVSADPSGLLLSNTSISGAAAASAAATAAAAAVAALRAAPSAPPQHTPPLSPPSYTSPRIPNGRAEAAAAAAEIRRNAWNTTQQSQQHQHQHPQYGGWPNAASLPSSLSATPACSTHTSVSGNVFLPGGGAPVTLPGSATRLVPTNHRVGSAHPATCLPLRRSADLGEYSTERVASSRPGTVMFAASTNAAGATTAAATAAWLGSATGAVGALPRSPFALSISEPSRSTGGMSAASSNVAASVGRQLSGSFQPPQQHANLRIQVPATPATVSGGIMTHGSAASPSAAAVADTPVLRAGNPGDAGTPAEWHGSSAQQQQQQPWLSSAALQPTNLRASGSLTPGSPPLGTRAVTAPAAMPTGAPGQLPPGRRSFELEPRPGGFRPGTSARSPVGGGGSTSPAAIGFGTGSGAAAASGAGAGPTPGGAVKEAGGLGWMRGRLMKTCLAASLRTTPPPQPTPSTNTPQARPASGQLPATVQGAFAAKRASQAAPGATAAPGTLASAGTPGTAAMAPPQPQLMEGTGALPGSGSFSRWPWPWRGDVAPGAASSAAVAAGGGARVDAAAAAAAAAALAAGAPRAMHVRASSLRQS